MGDANYWQPRLPDNIFLAAKMAAGKDFVASFLIREAGFTKLAFADALKEEAAAHLGISVEELNARKLEFRPILQNWGVGKRDADQDYWVKEWARRRAAITGPVVVTDCRFPNEALYGIQIGAMVVRLRASDAVREARLRLRDGGFDPSWLNHISEQHIDALPVHLEISGEMPGEMYVPALADYYRQVQMAYWKQRQVVDQTEELK